MIFFISVLTIITNDVFGQCPGCATEPTCNITNNNNIVKIYEILRVECVVPVSQENTTASLSMLDSNNKSYLTYETIPDVTGYFNFEYGFCDKNMIGGKHNVSVNYQGSSGIFPFIFVQQYENPYNADKKCGVISDEKIPQWIKNNAGWWANDEIDDETFVSGIQFLIKEGIISVSSSSNHEENMNKKIPQWIKNIAGWWSEGLILDKEFLESIQYLVNHKIITLE